MTRRSVLAGAAVGGAAIVAAFLIPTAAQAATPATNLTAQQVEAKTHIKHVVLLMIESRSFDHLFGTLS